MSRDNFPKCLSLFANAVEIGHRTGNYFVSGNSAGNLSQILWIQGKLDESVSLAQREISLIGRDSPASAMLDRVLGIVFYERNDLEKSAECSLSSIRLCKASGFTSPCLPAYYCLAQTLLAEECRRGRRCHE